MNGSRPAVLGALVAAVGLVSGCSSAQVRPVEEVAASFSSSVAQEPAAACDLLAESTREQLVASEQKPCPQALGELELEPPGPVESVDAYELQARVVRGDGTLFLTVEDGRWLVMAAGCQPRERDQPYDCELEKG